MSAGEAMMQEQLDRIIARTELRIQQQGLHANELTLHGDEAERARRERGQMLTGLARLKKMANHIRPVAIRRDGCSAS
jgi:hypothetical protein